MRAGRTVELETDARTLLDRKRKGKRPATSLALREELGAGPYERPLLRP